MAKVIFLILGVKKSYEILSLTSKLLPKSYIDVCKKFGLRNSGFAAVVACGAARKIDGGLKTRRTKMRMLIHVKMPHKEFNAYVKDGSIGQKVKRILDEIRPEAVYFTE
jgi:hypothetical protein